MNQDEKNLDIENITDDELINELGKAYTAINRLNKTVMHRTILLNLERKMLRGKKEEDNKESEDKAE